MREHLGEDLAKNKLTSYLKRKKSLVRWMYTVAFLAVFVVVGVGASLRHYGQAKTNVDKIYACTFEAHEHTEDCYDENGELICGYADFYIHTHNDDCYDENGELICQLEEYKTHEHTDECYEEVRILICGFRDEVFEKEVEKAEEEIEKEIKKEIKEEIDEEIDEELEDINDEEADEDSDDEAEDSEEDEDLEDEDSDSDNDTVLDEEETDTSDSDSEEAIEDAESELDTLSGAAGLDDDMDDDMDEADEDSDTSDEDEDESVEDDDSDDVEDEDKPVHVHTDECYRIEKVLRCKEVKLHTHTDTCFDSNGKWICGELEIVEHIHDENCFELEDAKKRRSIRKRYYAETEHVKITAIVPGDANIPEEAEFKVVEITEDDNTKECEEIIEKMEEIDSYEIDYLLDIGFYLGEDEIEPEAEIEIIIEYIDEETTVSSDTEIVHFVENGESSVIMETEVDEEEGKITFQSDSFSIYAILTKKGLTTINPDNTVRNAFLESPYYDSSSALGVLGNFHALAFDDLYINVHCHGNVLARRAYMKANFANQDMYGNKKVSYIQMYRDINEACGDGNGDMLVLGDGHTFTISDKNIYTKDRLDISRLVGHPAYVTRDKDTGKTPYIDLAQLKRDAIDLSETIKDHCLAAGNTNVNVWIQDNQNRFVDVQNGGQVAIWNVKAKDLYINNYTRIRGLYDGGSYLIINVDCEGKNASVDTKIYTGFGWDGSNNPEAGRRILWNFYNSSKQVINIDKEMIYGTILAPDAEVGITAQLQGAVIANKVTISTAESHFYPYTGKVPEMTEITVNKVWENVQADILNEHSAVVSIYRTTNESIYKNAKETADKNSAKKQMEYKATATLNKDNKWTYTFSGLEKHDINGKKYYYYAFEDSVKRKDKDVTSEFDAKYNTKCESSQEIVNRCNQLILNLEAEKLVDGQRPTDDQIFKFTVYKWNSDEVRWIKKRQITNTNEVIRFEDNISWYYHNITYYFYIEEEVLSANNRYEYDKSGYIFALTKRLENGLTKIEVVKYKLKPGETRDSFNQECKFVNILKHCDVVDKVVFNNTTRTTSIDIKKQWRNVASITKPVKVQVKLFSANKENELRENWVDTGKIIELTDNPYWIGKFENLPAFDEKGNELFYYVEEGAVINKDGNTENGMYKVTYSNNNGIKEGQIVITNTHERVEDYTDITVKKNWYDTDLKNTSQYAAESIDFKLWRTKTTIKRRINDKDPEETRDVTVTVAGNMKPFKLTVVNGDTIEFKTNFYYDYCNLEKFGDNNPEKFKKFLQSMTFNYPTRIEINPENREVIYSVSIPVNENTGKDISVLSEKQANNSNWYWDLKYVFISNKVYIDDIRNNGQSVMDRDSTWEWMGDYTVSKDDGWILPINHLPLMVTEDGVTTSYVYGVEEIVPDNCNYKLLGYFPDKIGSYENITEGQFSICNMINSTDIIIEKEWYTREGNRLGDTEATEVSINIKVYQTKQKNRPENTDGDVLVGEYILQRQSVSKVYQNDDFKNVKLSTVNAVGYDVIDEWKFKLSELPNCDSNRNLYYYYAVETKIGECLAEDTIYQTEYGDENGDKAITGGGTLVIKNYGTQTFDFLPSTGGRGTINYWIKKWFKDLFKFNGVS